MNKPALNRDTILLYLKGIAMGAADVVPGVSGGTIALISGIYQELVESISKLGIVALKILFKDGLSVAWNHVNGWFLLVLFAGVLTSIVLLSHAILFLLHSYPIPMWSFFFGLILAASLHLGATIEKIQSVLVYLVAGIVAGYLLTELAPVQTEFSYTYLFISGAIAICAMILPGISGSFILLMLGMYVNVLSAVKGFDLPIMAVFAAGCLVGLLAFSRLLSWLLQHAHNITMAVLLGVMLGSLNRVWPWKEVLAYQIKSNGEQVAIVHRNLFPADFGEITGSEPQLLVALLMMVVGIVIVFLPDFLTGKKNSV
ncbi:MAG: DUF368 domain-containing protein [Pseudomonadales bacterium]|nr:DUF368 domain-containing protein [Pseudomonadales bacterium]